MRMIRSAILALVLATLVAPAAFARPAAGRPAVPAQGFEAVWEWVVSLFAPVSPAAKAPRGGIMTKEGSSMDPNGKSCSGMIFGGKTTNAGRILGENGVY